MKMTWANLSRLTVYHCNHRFYLTIIIKATGCQTQTPYFALQTGLAVLLSLHLFAQAMSSDQFWSRGTMASCTPSPCQQHAAGSGLWRRRCQMRPPPALEVEERRRPALPPALLAASFSMYQDCGRISELQLSVQHPTTEIIPHTTPASPIHYKTLAIRVTPHCSEKQPGQHSRWTGRKLPLHLTLTLAWLEQS